MINWLPKCRKSIGFSLIVSMFMLCLSCVAQPPASPNKVPQQKPITIQSLYGTVIEDNPFIKDLIAHPALRRLQSIDQAGPGRYFRSLPAYSLFDHALGVYCLLKRFKRPLKEQTAGLLESVSHSVFSHQGTLYLRPKISSLPYYLAAHSGFLKRVGLDRILKDMNLTATEVNPIHKEFTALRQNPPFLSAIEIEMTLRLSYSYKLLSKKDISRILNDLRFDHGHWFFVSQKSAERLARLSLYFAEQYWGSHQNYVLSRWVAAAIKRALSLKLLSLNDIRFGTDKNILTRLMQMKDDVIKGLLIQCRQPFRFYDVVKSQDYDEIYKPEYRGLNPLVRVQGELKRLTEVDAAFQKYFEKIRMKFYNGIRIKYKKAPKGLIPFQNQT